MKRINEKKKKRKKSYDDSDEDEPSEDESLKKKLNELKQKEKDLKEREAEIKKLEKNLKSKPKKTKKDDDDDASSDDKVEVIAVGYKVEEGRPNFHLNGSFGIAIIENMHGYGSSFTRDDVSQFSSKNYLIKKYFSFSWLKIFL